MTKRSLIIIATVVLFILLLAGGWWYLLMNGRPDTIAGFTNPFGAPSEESFVPVTTDITDEPRTFETALRKLSDSPVAGASFVENETGVRVRYAERGTGHIFEADPETGERTRIIGTTIPRTIEATWAPQGNRVALLTETTLGEPRIFVGTIERNDEGAYQLSTTEIEGTAKNLAFTEEGESLLYTVAETNGATGYTHDLRTNTREVVFSTPLKEIRVASWEPLVTYTAPTASFPGYAYGTSNIERLFGGPAGLIVSAQGDLLVTTYLRDGSLVSTIGDPAGPGSAITVFPEKCTEDAVADTFWWCASPLTLPQGTYPDNWYQGTTSFNDIIWHLNVRTGDAALVSIPREDVGEEIDAVELQANSTGDLLIFINKKDGALWLQETDA